jgi:hypothetical protein
VVADATEDPRVRAGVTAAAVAVAGMAFAYEGNPTAEVDLHDGGVWLTKTSSLLVGHFNNQSRVLDGGLRTGGENYDVLQSGGTVLVTDRRPPPSPASTRRASCSATPCSSGGAKSALGGTTVAILDPKEGKLWVRSASSLSGFKPAGTKPSATLGAGADVTVGKDGTVYGVSAKDRSIVTVHVDEQGDPQPPSTEKIELAENAKPDHRRRRPPWCSTPTRTVFAAGHRAELDGAR